MMGKKAAAICFLAISITKGKLSRVTTDFSISTNITLGGGVVSAE